MLSYLTHRRNRLAILTLLISGMLSAPVTRIYAQAQTSAASVALPPGVERVTSVEGITEYSSPNGCACCCSLTDEADSRSTSPIWSARATRATARPAWRTCSST